MARHQGRVVFVRHALPGELVLARLTEAGDQRRFWRADAIEVLTPSPDRVEPHCPVAGPGGCGGCDWQHADPAAQRRGKAAVLAEQLRRLGGVDPAIAERVEVEPLPGDEQGLGWRTRVRFAVDADGRAGFRRHRSHQVVPVRDCPIAHHRVNELGVPRREWPGIAAVEVVAPAAGPDRLVVVEPATPRADVDLPAMDGVTAIARHDTEGLRRLRGRGWVEESVLVDGRRVSFRVTGSGFWQVHPGAAQALLDAVLAAADPRPGERAIDLYSGVGLFAAGLAERVGPTGLVIAVEADQRAVADARRSLHDCPQVRLEHGTVRAVLARLGSLGQQAGSGSRGGSGSAVNERPDVVVLDPPRAGAGRAVIEQVAGLRPRVVVYVACDGAALARDVATAGACGYALAGLRAFDAFPMTHHVECVATLVPSSGAVAE